MTQRTKYLGWVALLLALTLTGCQSGTQTKEGGEEGSTETSGTKGSAAKKEKAPEPVVVTIPAGTEINIRLGSTIDSGKVQSGQSFEGTLASDISVDGKVVAAAGSSVEGKITNAVSSGRLKRPAELALVLTSMTVKGGKTVSINTDTWAMKGKSHAKRNAAMIGGGAGAGALIGGLAGGGKGAAIGAAVGAGAGTAGAAATGKDEIVLAPETALSFKLESPVKVTL